MKKGICLGCVPGDTLDAKLKLAKDAGFDGVEINAAEDDQTILNSKEAADGHGLEIPSIMGGLHWSHPLSSPDAQTRKLCSEGFKQSLRQARSIGVNTVLLVPAVVTDDVPYEDAWQRSIQEIRDLANVAEQEQVYLALENVWNKFLLSPIEFNQYLDEIASPFVNAYFDCGNIVAYGYPHHWIRSLGHRIQKIHVKGFTVFPNVGFPHSLEGDVPWAACRKAWQDIGYDDYLTVEIGPDPNDKTESMYRYSEQLDRIIEGRI